MDNKSFFKKPKYMSIKLFIFSLTTAMVLWIWGLLSTRDLINNAVNQANLLPNPSVALVKPASTTTQPSTALRKVTVPTQVPVTTSNSNRLPLTNTGSSRP
jgi:hypothetical protein